MQNTQTITTDSQIKKEQSTPSANALKALEDILAAFINWRIWLLLSWQDIRMRYRRSILGPFWITLSVAVTIYTMGFLYGKLFKLDLSYYYPFLAIGLLTWNLILGLITDGANCFIEAESFLKQMKLPYLSFIFRMISRNLIIFAHHLIVLVPIFLFMQIHLKMYAFLSFYGLFIILINAINYGVILAILSTRYRDCPQFIACIMQVIFFLTPILWVKKALPEYYYFTVDYNPFAQIIELVRNPLLGQLPTAYAVYSTLLITVIGFIASFTLFSRYRSRIVYWL